MCKDCVKTYVFKWRLRKHEENHNNMSLKKCHFFNNEKACPFEQIGCMFAHSPSEKCKNGKNCRYKLCSYKHNFKNIEHLKVEDEPEVEIMVENVDTPAFKCNKCGKQYENENDLVDHLIKTMHNLSEEDMELLFGN